MLVEVLDAKVVVFGHNLESFEWEYADEYTGKHTDRDIEFALERLFDERED